MKFETTLARQYAAAKKDRQTGRFFAALRQALEKGEIRPEEFSVRRLFEAFVPDGRELVESWNPRFGGGYSVAVLEAGGVVDTTAFSNINGQLFITKVLESWNNPTLLWPELVTVTPTTLNGEKIPGIAVAADEIDTVPEGAEYGSTGLSEIYIETPVVPKKGTIINVTQEAIFHDRTGILLKQAGTIAEAMAMNLEKRVLDCVFGITNTYKRNGVASNTYLASGAYVNIKASTPLTSYQDIDAVQQLFEDMVDPDTGEPVVVMPNTLIVPTALRLTADRIMAATQVRVASGTAFAADPTDNAEVFTYSPNPMRNPIRVLSSQYVKARSGSASTWFFGDPKRAFELMENWPITVQQAPPDSEAAFSRDIVTRFKVSHKATPAVIEPRRMAKVTA